MSRKTFMKGAVILGAAGVIVKILGAFFRIPLGNIIGDTGMGYYQTAYPVYVLLLAISTAGIPTAIARLVSEQTAEGNHREAFRVFRLSFGLLAAIGMAGFLILLLGAPFFAGFSSKRAVYAIRAISPALLLISMMAAFRGYFQGLQDMMPTAVSQVAEQFFRVVSGLALAVLLLPRGIEYAAAGASFGAVAGGLSGLLVILVIYFRRRSSVLDAVRSTPAENPREDARSIIKKIVVIAVPITVGVSVMPVMNMIDLLLVPGRLTVAGFSPEEANRLYGQLSGFAASLINLPQVLTQSIALSLVPAIAAAHQVKDRKTVKQNTETGLRMAMIVGFPCATGMLALAEPDAAAFPRAERKRGQRGRHSGCAGCWCRVPFLSTDTDRNPAGDRPADDPGRQPSDRRRMQADPDLVSDRAAFLECPGGGCRYGVGLSGRFHPEYTGGTPAYRREV